MTPPLTVIRGGIEPPSSGKRHKFIKGRATNTRLMGVVGLELEWDVLRNSRVERLHQIFYLDFEEYGLESCTEGYGDMPPDIMAEKVRLYNALGGSHVSVSEEEARFLVQAAAEVTMKYNEPFPEGREKYSFLLKPQQTLTLEDYRELHEKICGAFYSTYYVINHYLMRCVAGDARGAAWLTINSDFPANDTVTPSELPDMSGCELFSNFPGTLHKNTIEPHGNPEDCTYLCESLVEINNRYRVVTSEIVLNSDSTGVVSARKHSDFRITSTEAAMLVNRPEFITVYDIPVENDEFLDSFALFAMTFTENTYENGRLYIDYNDTNEHVGKPVYLINNDIRSMYFFSDYGQIIVMAYDPDNIHEAETDLFYALQPYSLALSMRYQFQNPVLYEFIRSTFADFDSFVDFLSGDTEK